MRIRTKAMWMIGSLVAVLVAASKWPSPSDSENEPAVSADPANNAEEKELPPIIGHFVGRTHTITIHASSEEPRFTVATADGRVLVEALSASEIAEKYPEIYKLYRSTFAQSDGYLDAIISVGVAERKVSELRAKFFSLQQERH